MRPKPTYKRKEKKEEHPEPLTRQQNPEELESEWLTSNKCSTGGTELTESARDFSPEEQGTGESSKEHLRTVYQDVNEPGTEIFKDPVTSDGGLIKSSSEDSIPEVVTFECKDPYPVPFIKLKLVPDETLAEEDSGTSHEEQLVTRITSQEPSTSKNVVEESSPEGTFVVDSTAGKHNEATTEPTCEDSVSLNSLEEENQDNEDSVAVSGEPTELVTTEEDNLREPSQGLTGKPSEQPDTNQDSVEVPVEEATPSTKEYYREVVCVVSEVVTASITELPPREQSVDDECSEYQTTSEGASTEWFSENSIPELITFESEDECLSVEMNRAIYQEAYLSATEENAYDEITLRHSTEENCSEHPPSEVTGDEDSEEDSSWEEPLVADSTEKELIQITQQNIEVKESGPEEGLKETSCEEPAIETSPEEIKPAAHDESSMQEPCAERSRALDEVDYEQNTTASTDHLPRESCVEEQVSEIPVTSSGSPIDAQSGDSITEVPTVESEDQCRITETKPDVISSEISESQAPELAPCEEETILSEVSESRSMKQTTTITESCPEEPLKSEVSSNDPIEKDSITPSTEPSVFATAELIYNGDSTASIPEIVTYECDDQCPISATNDFSENQASEKAAGEEVTVTSCEAQNFRQAAQTLTLEPPSTEKLRKESDEQILTNESCEVDSTKKDHFQTTETGEISCKDPVPENRSGENQVTESSFPEGVERTAQENTQITELSSESLVLGGSKHGEMDSAEQFEEASSEVPKIELVECIEQQNNQIREPNSESLVLGELQLKEPLMEEQFEEASSEIPKIELVPTEDNNQEASSLEPSVPAVENIILQGLAQDELYEQELCMEQAVNQVVVVAIDSFCVETYTEDQYPENSVSIEELPEEHSLTSATQEDVKITSPCTEIQGPSEPDALDSTTEHAAEETTTRVTRKEYVPGGQPEDSCGVDSTGAELIPTASQPSCDDHFTGHSSQESKGTEDSEIVVGETAVITESCPEEQGSEGLEPANPAANEAQAPESTQTGCDPEETRLIQAEENLSSDGSSSEGSFVVISEEELIQAALEFASKYRNRGFRDFTDSVNSAAENTTISEPVPEQREFTEATSMEPASAEPPIVQPKLEECIIEGQHSEQTAASDELSMQETRAKHSRAFNEMDSEQNSATNIELLPGDSCVEEQVSEVPVTLSYLSDNQETAALSTEGDAHEDQTFRLTTKTPSMEQSATEAIAEESCAVDSIKENRFQTELKPAATQPGELSCEEKVQESSSLENYETGSSFHQEVENLARQNTQITDPVNEAQTAIESKPEDSVFVDCSGEAKAEFVTMSGNPQEMPIKESSTIVDHPTDNTTSQEPSPVELNEDPVTEECFQAAPGQIVASIKCPTIEAFFPDQIGNAPISGDDVSGEQLVEAQPETSSDLKDTVITNQCSEEPATNNAFSEAPTATARVDLEQPGLSTTEEHDLENQNTAQTEGNLSSDVSSSGELFEVITEEELIQIVLDPSCKNPVLKFQDVADSAENATIVDEHGLKEPSTDKLSPEAPIEETTPEEAKLDECIVGGQYSEQTAAPGELSIQVPSVKHSQENEEADSDKMAEETTKRVEEQAAEVATNSDDASVKLSSERSIPKIVISYYDDECQIAEIEGGEVSSYYRPEKKLDEEADSTNQNTDLSQKEGKTQEEQTSRQATEMACQETEDMAEEIPTIDVSSARREYFQPSTEPYYQDSVPENPSEEDSKPRVVETTTHQYTTNTELGPEAQTPAEPLNEESFFEVLSKKLPPEKFPADWKVGDPVSSDVPSIDSYSGGNWKGSVCEEAISTNKETELPAIEVPSLEPSSKEGNLDSSAPHRATAFTNEPSCEYTFLENPSQDDSEFKLGRQSPGKPTLTPKDTEPGLVAMEEKANTESPMQPLNEDSGKDDFLLEVTDQVVVVVTDQIGEERTTEEPYVEDRADNPITNTCYVSEEPFKNQASTNDTEPALMKTGEFAHGEQNQESSTEPPAKKAITEERCQEISSNVNPPSSKPFHENPADENQCSEDSIAKKEHFDEDKGEDNIQIPSLELSVEGPAFQEPSPEDFYEQEPPHFEEPSNVEQVSEEPSIFLITENLISKVHSILGNTTSTPSYPEEYENRERESEDSATDRNSEQPKSDESGREEQSLMQTTQETCLEPAAVEGKDILDLSSPEEKPSSEESAETESAEPAENSCEDQSRDDDSGPKAEIATTPSTELSLEAQDSGDYCEDATIEEPKIDSFKPPQEEPDMQHEKPVNEEVDSIFDDYNCEEPSIEESRLEDSTPMDVDVSELQISKGQFLTTFSPDSCPEKEEFREQESQIATTNQESAEAPAEGAMLEESSPEEDSAKEELSDRSVTIVEMHKSTEVIRMSVLREISPTPSAEGGRSENMAIEKRSLGLLALYVPTLLPFNAFKYVFGMIGSMFRRVINFVRGFGPC